ncbi:MAG: S-layer protein [Candidatus Peregrinibacteria bacterium GW2011_GWF2_33_10]|nr:MAG: S-layer protein [Candidatus Peregrinibacteria bacterium GW2011_GWF2_33_10]OGJ45580.1 MAG: hypothetical protein A2263_00550 [Candidatus Peregrinibacteria bacterium RIFOXYA2_FULL_33_21]OGJ45958.1 MAG: hypothetical protein A2272_04405 [Candidatus Peregrinibacteria bacterium RIFOXYA12_FULL_33_12]OGJ51091.1 MAG: hypothetical protein A2307_06460 [Candidatus Peregrinibacteria bacterium RIFOXYB2_FULL_33_20]
MKTFKKVVSAMLTGAMMLMLMPTMAFGALSTRTQTYTVNTVLSTEYLVQSSGDLNGARIGVVAVDTVDTTDTTSDVLGMIYYKSHMEYPDGAFEGTITNDTLVLTGNWVNAYETVTGTISMTFKVTGDTTATYVVSGTGTLTSSDDSVTTTENFTFSQTPRGKYAQHEMEELQDEIEGYLTGAEEFSPGDPIPPMSQMLTTEYMTSDGYRFVLFVADEAKLAEYGIDSDYNTVGIAYKTTQAPTFDSIMFGNTVEDDSTNSVWFDGYWAKTETNYSPMYIQFKTTIKTLSNGDGYYLVTGNGDWWTDRASDTVKTDNFTLTETARAKYSKHEAQELEDDLYAYIEDNEEEVTDALDEAETEADTTTTTNDDTVTTTDTCNPFTDVNSSYEYCESVQYVKDEGIVSGYPDGTYKPTNTINRAEFTKIVMGAVTTEEERAQCLTDNTQKDFSDTSRYGNVAWVAGYVCVAKAKGIISGYKDGTFQPNRQIALSEAAKITSLAFELIDVPATPSEPWYKYYIDALATKNAIPLSFDTFDQAVERGEMAEMVERLHMPDPSKDSETYSSLGGTTTETTSQYDLEVQNSSINIDGNDIIAHATLQNNSIVNITNVKTSDPFIAATYYKGSAEMKTNQYSIDTYPSINGMLNANADGDFNIYLTQTDIETYTSIKICFDPSNLVKEFDENNNCKTTNIEVDGM